MGKVKREEDDINSGENAPVVKKRGRPCKNKDRGQDKGEVEEAGHGKSRGQTSDNSDEESNHKKISKKISKKGRKEDLYKGSNELPTLKERPKRIMKVKTQYIALEETKKFTSTESYMVQHLLNLLKTHPASNALMLSESAMGYTTKQFQYPYQKHITLNNITLKLNNGQYDSAAEFYTDVTRMFKRNLLYLPKGENLTQVQRVEEVYIEFLQKYNLEAQIDQYQPDQDLNTPQKEDSSQSMGKAKMTLQGTSSKNQGQDQGGSEDQKEVSEIAMEIEEESPTRNWRICSQEVNIMIGVGIREYLSKKKRELMEKEEREKREQSQEREEREEAKENPISISQKKIPKSKKPRKYLYSDSSNSPIKPPKEHIIKKFQYITEILPIDSD